LNNINRVRRGQSIESTYTNVKMDPVATGIKLPDTKSSGIKLPVTTNFGIKVKE